MNNALKSKLSLRFRAPESQLMGPIKYAIGSCGEGEVLVARSAKGICAIFLDDHSQGLRDQLCAIFPAFKTAEVSQELQGDLAQVISFIDKGTTDLVITLDIGGTDFQQRVWEALCEIPMGETRTYAQVAQSIGAPDAVRAVAGACAANVLAIAIPCHRVIRGDGCISGYRWGVERKRVRLERECGR